MDALAKSPLLPLKAVLHTTDFSPASDNAGRYASLLARQCNAELLIVHTFMLTQAALELEAGSSIKSTQRKDLEAALAEAAKQLEFHGKPALPVLAEGEPYEQIPRLARSHAPAIIVLGTQARSRLDRGIVGSAAERILRSTESPALTVGPNVPLLETQSNPIRRILYATILSPAFARTAGFAAGMAKALDAKLEVLHVVPTEDASDPARLGAAQQRLADAIAGLPAAQAQVVDQPAGIVEAGSAHERILEHIRAAHIDLLVITLHKSTPFWLESRLSGAFYIAANAACPVITIAG